MIQSFVAGLLVGLFIAMPLGPVSLTCIRNAVRDGPLAALMSSLGAASAHTLFAMVAGIGAATIAAIMTDWQRPISLTSASILICLGLTHVNRANGARGLRTSGKGARALGAFPACLMMALSNPITILLYLAVGPSLTAAPNGSDLQHVLALAVGAGLGSCGWYMSITGITLAARRAFTQRVTDRLDLLSGLALIGFGCALVSQHV